MLATSTHGIATTCFKISSGLGSSMARMDILEIRVKEIMDVSSFWAQIGTVKHLAEYDNQQAAMSAWCKTCKAGVHQTTTRLKLEDVVALKGKTEGLWDRGKITKKVSERLVEVFHVDTGCTEYVDVGSICAGTPPMLCDIPQQALQCSLSGVEVPEGADDWSNAAVARFTELVSTPTKALIHKVVNKSCIILSIFTEYCDQFTSVGEILRKEGLAQYTPCSPLTLDIPVSSKSDSGTAPPVAPSPPLPAKTHTSERGTTLDSPISLNSSAAPKVVPTQPELSSTSANARTLEKEASAPIFHDPNTESEAVSLSNAALPPSTNPNRDPIDFGSGGLPQTPPVEELSSEEVQLKVVPSPVPEIAVKMPRSTSSLPVNAQALASVSTLVEDASPVTPVSEWSSSGSSLSDNDWLDEDLLPHKSGNSEVSDVVVESPVKSSEEPKLSPKIEKWPSSEELRSETSTHFVSNMAGHTPHSQFWRPSRLFSSSQNLGGDEGVAKGNQRWMLPRGRGQHKSGRGREYSGGRTGRRGYRSDHGDRERSWNVTNKGRGRGHFTSDMPNKVRPTRQLYTSPPNKFLSQSLEDEGRELSLPTPPAPVVSSPKPLPSLASPKPPTTSYSKQIQDMTEQERADEVKWQEWKLEKALGKVISSLSADNVGGFGEEVEKLLHGSGADKLSELPNSRQPLEIILHCVLKEGVEGGVDLKLLVMAVHSMMQSSYVLDLLQLWLPAVKKTASHICETCDSKETSKKPRSFCHFLGALFASLPADSDTKHGEAIIAAVKDCLMIWSKGFFLESQHCEQRGKLRVDCFGWLMDSIDLTNEKAVWEGVVSELLDGPLMECVLCDKHPRFLRMAWYGEIVKIVKAVYRDPLPCPPVPEEPHPKATPVPEGKVQPVHAKVEPTGDVLQQHGMEPNQLYQLTPIPPQGQMQSRVESNLVPQGMEQSRMHQGMEQNQVYLGMEQNQMHRGMEPPPHELKLGHQQKIMEYTQHSFSNPRAPMMPHPLLASSIPLPSHPLLSNMAPQEVAPYQPPPGGDVLGGSESYTRVMVMLETLHMTELFPKFRAAMIKDSVLDCNIEKVKECLKDAGVPSGPVVEIMHYLECKQLGTGRTHHAPPPRQPSGYATPYLQTSTPATPPLAPGNSLHYFPTVPNMFTTGQQQLVTPYQMTSPHMVYNTTPPEGVCYTGGGSGVPTSPLATYQMVPPPAGKHLPQSQFSQHPREVLPSTSNVGSPATGQMLHKSDSNTLHKSDSNTLPSDSSSESNVTLTGHMEQSNDGPPPLSIHKQLQQQLLQPQSPSPVSGFGRVSCVVCGGSDHVTYNCTQRNKFFTHM